ncbi:MAG: lignostilbene alpha-beta-dioxygenase [Bradyrhizobium sp.]|nr:lignostilbene alpha-beta-dioxygenase [Bradyrhizobium sp.]
MAVFPTTRAFAGYNQPVRMEAEVLDCEVEGSIPDGIAGSFYRVQPDPQFPPLLGDDIAFNGDGQVSMFRFEGGRVDFRHRWVRTDKFVLEQAAGRALFGAYRNPLSDDPQVHGRYRGTANTNIVPHGGKLYALKEDSPPVLLDPATIETIGYTDFAGKLGGQTFTAHPKLDPVTGQMIAFGYAAKGMCTRDMVYYEISPDGELTRETWFELPYYCMMHDFGVTRDYAVFHVVPIVGSVERLERGMPHFGFDTTKEIWLGVLPRNGEARDIRWFTAPNCFASHVMNAFNDGRKIYFDTPVARNNMFPFFPDVHGAPFDPRGGEAHLTRWTIDLDRSDNGFSGVEQLSKLSGEFPRIDDRYAMQPYRHGYMLVQDASKPASTRSISGLSMNTLSHRDHATGREKCWFVGADSGLQEPCFIPAHADAPEGEGWLVSVALRYDEMRSDLLLFDAQRVDEGPVATVKLPMRLRFGLHGNWQAA